MQDYWNSGINCGEGTMVKVIPIVKKQKKAELEQIIMRFLEREYDAYEKELSRWSTKFREKHGWILEPKEQWMTNRIAKIYSGE